MEELARKQHRYRIRQRLKQWFAPHAWIPALLVFAFALIDALGYLPSSWSKWITVALAVLTFLTLFIDRKPVKSESERTLDQMQKQMKRKG